MDIDVVKSGARPEDYAPDGSRQAAIEDDSPQILERFLLLTFVVVAAISIMWHLGTGLQWLWTSCAAQLHSAVVQAGIS